MDNHFEIRPLTGLAFNEIAEAFLSAFADYNISFSKDKLRAMLKRRGADFNLSFGAFHDGRLVSFILNGIGSYGGAKSAYDTGTGTVKEFRGLGLTDRIFNFSLPYLREAGVESYVLEVLQDNAPAVKIYMRQGFRIVRELNCYSASRPPVSSAVLAVRIERAEVEDIAALRQSFDGFAPSWQNDIASVRRAQEAMTCLVAYEDGVAVGYGATEPAYGDIALLAVSKSHRRRGIGSLLLAELMRKSRTEECRMVNVDAGDTSLNHFLLAAGFTLSCTQYEMKRSIRES